MSRLDEIKKRAQAVTEYDCIEDRHWLLSQVERLREALANLPVFGREDWGAVRRRDVDRAFAALEADNDST